jgi:hypothetical protein
MSKGHFVFEIGIFRAFALFAAWFASGVAAGVLWAGAHRLRGQRREKA